MAESIYLSKGPLLTASESVLQLSKTKNSEKTSWNQFNYWKTSPNVITGKYNIRLEEQKW